MIFEGIINNLLTINGKYYWKWWYKIILEKCIEKQDYIL